MRENSIHIKISTPTGIFLEDDVEELVVPGEEGYFGVQTDHTPFISSLMPGKLSTFSDDSERDFAIHNGFVVLRNNNVNILTETIERPEDIDKSRAESARERAKKRLREKEQETDLRRAEAALRRSLSRLEIALD